MVPSGRMSVRCEDMNQKRKRIIKSNLIAYSFLAPSFFFLVWLGVIPLVISLFVSFTDWNYTKGFGNWTFLGLKNFIDLWSDEWFLASLKNTLIYTIVTVPVTIILSLMVAALIQDYCRDKYSRVLRTVMYMPKICNIVASSAVWVALLSSYGPFTQMMRDLGWKNPPRWLADYNWALPSLMLVSVWMNLGYRIFLYSASLQSISDDLYEAAEIDGANKVQQFFKITIPMLRPTTFFLVITGIIGSFKMFGTTNVMTQGGPGHATYTLVYYIYKTAFSYYRMGYASAVAVILFVLLLVVTMIQWNHNKKNEEVLA